MGLRFSTDWSDLYQQNMLFDNHKSLAPPVEEVGQICLNPNQRAHYLIMALRWLSSPPDDWHEGDTQPAR